MKTIRNFKNMHNETYNFLHTVHIQQSNSKSTEWSACKDWDSVGCEQRLGQCGVRAKIGTGKGGGGCLWIGEFCPPVFREIKSGKFDQNVFLLLQNLDNFRTLIRHNLKPLFLIRIKGTVAENCF